MSTALFVDPNSRGIFPVCTVSVTEVKGKGLVLRFGAEVGNLSDLVGQNIDLPVIVTTRGWSARSSAGFVSVKSGLPKQSVIGLQGMPFMKGSKGLRLLGSPMEVVVLDGAEIRRIQTHAGEKKGGGWNSNSDSAAAADAALAIRGQINPFGVIISEGQSDYTFGWELSALSAPKLTLGKCCKVVSAMEWPKEFREDRFTDEAIAEKVLRSLTSRWDKEKEERHTDVARQVYYLALAMAVIPATDNFVREKVINPILNGISDAYWAAFKSAARGLMEQCKNEGWQIFVRLVGSAVGQLVVSSPDGQETIHEFASWLEGNEWRIVEDRLIGLDDSTPAEKAASRLQRRTEMLKEELAKPLKANETEWDCQRREALGNAAKFIIFPASGTHYPTGDEFTFDPMEGVEPIEAKSLSDIMSDPRFSEVAGASPVFLAAYDQDGHCFDSQYLYWENREGNMCFRFGWNHVQSPRPLNSFLEVMAAKSTVTN